jgi:hypothetical protein
VRGARSWVRVRSHATTWACSGLQARLPDECCVVRDSCSRVYARRPRAHLAGADVSHAPESRRVRDSCLCECPASPRSSCRRKPGALSFSSGRLFTRTLSFVFAGLLRKDTTPWACSSAAGVVARVFRTLFPSYTRSSALCGLRCSSRCSRKTAWSLLQPHRMAPLFGNSLHFGIAARAARCGLPSTSQPNCT